MSFRETSCDPPKPPGKWPLLCLVPHYPFACDAVATRHWQKQSFAFLFYLKRPSHRGFPKGKNPRGLCLVADRKPSAESKRNVCRWSESRAKILLRFPFLFHFIQQSLFLRFAICALWGSQRVIVVKSAVNRDIKSTFCVDFSYFFWNNGIRKIKINLDVIYFYLIVFELLNIFVFVCEKK